jgi:hypothetical protein
MRRGSSRCQREGVLSDSSLLAMLIDLEMQAPVVDGCDINGRRKSMGNIGKRAAEWMRITCLALICEWSLGPSHECCERPLGGCDVVVRRLGASGGESVEKYLE